MLLWKIDFGLVHVTLEDPREGPRIFYPSTLVEDLCVEGWGFRGSKGVNYECIFIYCNVY